MKLTFFAEDETCSKQHVFVYKLTPLNGVLGEERGEDLYVAVPNGKRISLMDLPDCRYLLEPVNASISRGMTEINLDF